MMAWLVALSPHFAHASTKGIGGLVRNAELPGTLFVIATRLFPLERTSKPGSSFCYIEFSDESYERFSPFSLKSQ
jgi:hypothetical protein